MRKAHYLLLTLALAFCAATAMTGCGQNAQVTQRQPTLTIHKSEATWVVLYHDIKSLKQNADIIVDGTIAGVARLTGKPPLVFTQFIFHISRIILDQRHLVTGTQVIVNQTGGIVGNDLYEIEDDPLFQQDEAALLFLHQYAPGLYDVIGGPSGRFRIQGGMVTPINDEGVKFTASMTEANFIGAIQGA